MATDDSGDQFVVASSAGAQSYSVNIQPQQTFLVVGNVPGPRLYSGPNPLNHFEATYTQSGYTIGISAGGSGNGTKTTAKSNFPADKFLEKNSGNISSVLRKAKSDVSRKRPCNRPVNHKLQCSECGEVSPSFSNLAHHLATQHSNCIKSFKCLYCAQTFFSQESVVHHIKSVLLGKKPSPTHVAGMISCVKHTCPVCTHVHVSAQHLKVHLLKSQCGGAGTRQTSEVQVKNTKLDCMKAVLQSYKPTIITLNKNTEESVDNSARERDVSIVNTSTSLSACETETNTSHPNRDTDQQLVPLSDPDKGQSGVPPPPCNISQMEHCKPCPPPPIHFYPQPTTYIRAPLVMSLPVAPTQYYNLDYYQYPATNMTPAHHLPHQYTYQPRVACPGDSALLDKQLFSCLHCGSKFPEFDMLARHFRENTCNSAAHSSLEGIVSCCPETPY